WYASTEDAEQSQSALGGGGRYDGLVELLGGRPTPAVGCAFGVDRIISRLKEKNPPSPDQHRYASVDVFIAQLGDMGRKKALALFEEFREAGIPVGEAFAKSNIKAQMEVANKRQAKWALVLGQKEVLDGTVLIRDMDAGSQETVDIKKAVHEIKKKLQNLKA
ncbi:MAG: ATP phosphoribosyltransferase regulatory subunit, partial [Candidatus Magasanikbacteria bacterium]|nr:ATP phosphoribosyltransferase regulatory subunit [Candidatus Magasanikbacteria bacterium]